MTHRSLRSALSGRGFMLVPAAAFGVHQLRYELAYGTHADHALAAQGHGYLDSLAPWLAVLLALALGSFLVRVARRASGGSELAPRRRLGMLWLVASAGLLAIYSAQEALEGVFAAGHPGGLEGVFGHGGWWAVVLSALFGLVVALILRLADVALELAAPAVRHLVVVGHVTPRPPRIVSRRRSALAGASAGRAPPKAFPVVA